MDDTLAFDKIALLRLAFKALEDDELEQIANSTDLTTYSSDHVLCQEGAYEDIFYIIAEGSIVITKHISDEEGERILRNGGKGDLVGEMALIQNDTRSATVRTTTECTVLEMNKAKFESLLSRIPRMAIDLMGVTLDRMRANDQVAIKDLQETNKVLRQLDRNKLEFIQVAAHELRTPLTVLKGYVDVMKSFPDIQANETLIEVLGGITKGAGRMHDIVNLMLDVSRIDDDQLKIYPAPVSLKQVVQKIVKDFEEAVAERKIELVTHLTDDTPGIHAEPDMVRKALYNLIINAIKYTPDDGKVDVVARPVVLDGGTPGVELVVKDTGIGLDAEHHELVFEKFYQVGSVALHSSGKTMFKGGGPGLGLAIVHGVARVHGGKTWVESEGHDEENYPGCTFYLQLPLIPEIE